MEPKYKKLIQDNDGHWYIIPSDDNALFSLQFYWCVNEGEDLPSWALRIDGPETVRFQDYEVR